MSLQSTHSFMYFLIEKLHSLSFLFLAISIAIAPSNNPTKEHGIKIIIPPHKLMRENLSLAQRAIKATNKKIINPNAKEFCFIT